MEMHQTHCYATVTIALLQQRYQSLDMSQYVKYNFLQVAKRHVGSVKLCS
jgi:hypothetical protein